MATNQTSELSFAQKNQLTLSLDPSRVAKRRQGGTDLSYLEAWSVKANLISIFGFGGFSAEVIESENIFREQVPSKTPGKTNWKVTYRARVRLTIHQTGAVYTEDAIADSSQPDFTEAADMALKSAESDALKRAAIYLGTQFGLSLYNKGSLFDVVQNVLLPGQEWPPTPEQVDAYQRQMAEHAAFEQRRMAAMQANQQQMIQQQQPPQPPPVQQGGPVPIQGQVFAPNPNLTPAQSQANQDLLNRALSARAELDAAASAEGA